MRRLLRVYAALIKVGWIRALEYRAQILIWMLSFLFPLIMMAVWLAVVDEAGPAAGWTRDDFIAYYVAAVLVNQITWPRVVWDWDEDLRTGALSMKLAKPLDPIHYLISDELGWLAFFLVVLLPMLLVAAALVPAIRYPLTPLRLLAFVVSAGLGFSLGLLMGMAFSMLGFWTTQVRNAFNLWWGVGQFMSGWIAPLAMLPAGLRGVAYALPFRGLLGLPVEILTGRLDARGIGVGLAVTAAWTLFFLVAYRLLWRAGLKRYDAVGG